MDDLANSSLFENKFAKSLDNLFKKRNDFYNSPRFNEIVEIIKREESINEDFLFYNIKSIKDLSHDDFSEFCATIYWKNKSDIVEESENQYSINYDGIVVYLDVGQGSSYFAKKIV